MRCALTAPFHPYRKNSLLGISAGGLLSVALSVGLLRLDVIKHRARPGGITRPYAVRTFLTRKTGRDRHFGRDKPIIVDQRVE